MVCSDIIMGKRRKIRLGDHWVTDDRTGIAHYNSKMVQQWDGLMVKQGSEENRHPQEFVRPKNDPYSVSLQRPEQGVDLDNVCGFYAMEWVPGTAIKRTLSQVDELLPLAGINQFPIGPKADSCGLLFEVQFD